MIADGLYPGMPFDEYAAIPAMNGSALLHLRRSPMKFRYECDHPSPATKAMILGAATHRMILEPERVDEFAVWDLRTDGGNLRPRNGKTWDEFQAGHARKMIVTVDERDAMVGMAVVARRNVPIMKYAGAKGPCEVSMFWTDPDTGRRWKGRVDKIVDKDVIFDLKTTRDARPFKFCSQAFQLGYHVKMAIYWSLYAKLTGREPKMRLGAIESKAPHESAVYRITPDILARGLEEWQELERLLSECERTNNWPAAEEVETDLLVPAWANTDAEDLSEFAEEEE